MWLLLSSSPSIINLGDKTMIINFLTFNIQHGKNYRTKQIDLDLMIKTIKDSQAEIIGLNEVFGANATEASQAKIMAQALGYDFYFAQAIDYHGRPYGNALLTKYPLKTAETIMIPDPIKNDHEFFETRCIIKATFQHFPLVLFTSHFGLAKGEQINAVKTSLELIKKERAPLVFMGDFNMEPCDPILKPLLDVLNNTFPAGPPTYPSINPQKKIDYILISPHIKVLKARILPVVASDHLPHLAILEIK